MLAFRASQIPHATSRGRALNAFNSGLNCQDLKQSTSVSPRQPSLTPVKFSIYFQTRLEYGQEINRWLIVYPFSLHREHLLGPCIFILCNTSQVRSLFLIACDMNIMDLIGDWIFQSGFHHHWISSYLSF